MAPAKINIMRLKVSSDQLLFDIEISDSKVVQYYFVHDRLQSTIERWVNHGIIDYIQVGRHIGDMELLHSTIDQPQFLPNLKSYLEKQFHFTYELLD